MQLPTVITRLLAAAIACGSIAAAQPAPPTTPFAQGVQMSVAASKDSRIKGGDWDDKMQKIVLTIKFANTGVRDSYENHTATVSVLGESAKDSKVKMVLLQETVPLALAPRKTVEHVCEEFTTRYDKTGTQFGYSYDGWIIVVKDAQGKVVAIKATNAAWEKLTELASKLEPQGRYTSKLKSLGSGAPLRK